MLSMIRQPTLIVHGWGRERDAEFFLRRGLLSLFEADIPGAKTRFLQTRQPANKDWGLPEFRHPGAEQYLHLIEEAEKALAALLDHHLLAQAPDGQFRFHDGGKWRRADPLVVGARLEAACPKYEEHLRTLAAAPAPLPGTLREQQQADKRAATAVR